MIFNLPLTQFVFWLWQACAIGALSDEEAEFLWELWISRRN